MRTFTVGAMAAVRGALFVAVWLVVANGSAFAATFQTLAVTGFNQDLIANGAVTPAASTTMSFDQVNSGGDNVFYEQGYTNPGGSPLSFGLPASGTVVSTVSGLSYQLANYTGNNSLYLANNGAVGTLVLTIPGRFQEIAFLGASANGSSTFSVRINFTDSSSTTYGTFTVLDWFDGTPFAIQGVGRVERTLQMTDESATNPRLYDTIITLSPADQLKQVASVVFTKSGNGTEMAIFAVSGHLLPPTITKAFSAASIQLNGSTSLSFTITNPNASTTLTGVAFTDTLPAGLVVSTPNGLTGSCGGGTITATVGSTSISLASATLAPSASCTFSVNVTGTTAGTKNNTTSTVTSNEGGTGSTASASVTVAAAAPPTIAKSFGAASIPLNGSTSLSFTINNPNASTTLTGVAFTDTLPAGLVVSTPNGLTGSCGGGTITATVGSGAVSLTGATLAASLACTFSVNVTGSALGTQNNTTGAVTSVEGGSGGTASASVTVVAIVAPPTSIPTLQPWALWLLSLLLILTGSVALRAHKIG